MCLPLPISEPILCSVQYLKDYAQQCELIYTKNDIFNYSASEKC